MKRYYLVTALVFLAASASDSWGQSKQETLPSAQTNQTPKSYERGTEQSPVIVKILPAEESEEKTAADAHREDEKTKNDRQLTLFTARLFWATVALSVIALFQLFVFGWQGIQLKRTVNLGREEFNATHRPRMRLKHVWFTGDQFAWRLNGPLEVNLDIVNIGNTKARVTWINYASIILPTGQPLPQRPPYDEIPPNDGVRISRFQTMGDLAGGITLARTVCDGIVDNRDVTEILWGRKRLYLVGSIEYWDAAGLRQTAFCRSLTYSEYPPKTLEAGRFEVENDPDYEYED